jgi:hypothetical protein
MSKITKIDTVRAELSRIASRNDRIDMFSPIMRACWSFPRVMVIGKLRIQPFEFDELIDILENVPSQAGEEFFWNFALGGIVPVRRDCQKKPLGVVVQLHEHRRLKDI